MADRDKWYEAVIEGDWKTAAAATKAAIAEGVAPLAIVTGYLMPAMDEVGRRFECEEYFVPEMLLSARAMKASMEICARCWRRRARADGARRHGTVKGDLHESARTWWRPCWRAAGLR